MKNLLTTKEAAERIRMSASYLNNARQADEGPAYLKFGNKVFYEDRDLDEWINQKKVSQQCYPLSYYQHNVQHTLQENYPTMWPPLQSTTRGFQSNGERTHLLGHADEHL